MILQVAHVPRLDVVIPGEPVAQGRPRFFRMGGGVRVADPEESVRWKGVAALLMEQAARRAGWTLATGPLVVVLDAIFPRPKHVKGEEREPKTTKPDVDNLLKASLDAGNGVLWPDDGQVVEATARKWWAASTERAAVHLVVLRSGGGA